MTFAKKFYATLMFQDITPPPPYPYSIHISHLADREEIDIIPSFEKAGVNIDGLVKLYNEDISKQEYDKLLPIYLGPFNEFVGTLVGVMNFKTSDSNEIRNVRFQAPVFLINLGRVGIPRPQSANYDIILNTNRIHYRRSIQISHEIQPRDTDRLAIKIAVDESSLHYFKIGVRDIRNRLVQSPPIEMICFVPRSRRTTVLNQLCR